MKHKPTFCGQNIELFNVKLGGTHPSYKAFKG